VLLCGIEAHICIWQTACDLVAGGRAVEVVADAVSSRRVLDREIGLRRAAEVGARLTTVETALFEMMARADDPRFRELVRIVK
jgi:nicotinamidase-related amidase